MTSITFFETYLYPTVSIMAAAWIVSRAGSVLIHTRLFGLWNRVPFRKQTMGNRKTYKVPAELLKEFMEAESVSSPKAKMIDALLNELLASTGAEAPQGTDSDQFKKPL